METLFEIEKPAYEIPTLAEIKTRDNGLTAVSTFSGCGGSSTGLRMAGWRIPYAVEFIPAARDTYRANYPTTFVDDRDIREIDPNEILEKIGLKAGELDLFEGSPPCSSFSTSNSSKDAQYGAMKEKVYSDGVKQTTDDLFDEWLRLLEGLNPRAILAENVPGLLTGSGSDFYDEIIERLDDLGYRVTATVYNSAHFGAATSRRRLIIAGIRKDVSDARIPIVRPVVESAYTLDDALLSLPNPIPVEEFTYAGFEGYAIHREWLKLEPGEGSEKFFNLVRPRRDRPLPTVTSTGAQNASASITHPDDPRKLTATEVAWVSGFPADYVLTGTPAQRYERIGRAVPPPLYAVVGKAIADVLKTAIN